MIADRTKDAAKKIRAARDRLELEPYTRHLGGVRLYLDLAEAALKKHRRRRAAIVRAELEGAAE